jgi:ketol-acid reductoisomerase
MAIYLIAACKPLLTDFKKKLLKLNVIGKPFSSSNNVENTVGAAQNAKVKPVDKRENSNT